jgi:hypothetical protein
MEELGVDADASGPDMNAVARFALEHRGNGSIPPSGGLRSETLSFLQLPQLPTTPTKGRGMAPQLVAERIPHPPNLLIINPAHRWHASCSSQFVPAFPGRER